MPREHTVVVSPDVVWLKANILQKQNRSYPVKEQVIFHDLIQGAGNK